MVCVVVYAVFVPDLNLSVFSLFRFGSIEFVIPVKTLDAAPRPEMVRWRAALGTECRTAMLAPLLP